MVEALAVVASFALIAGAFAIAARHGRRRVAIPALFMRQTRPRPFRVPSDLSLRRSGDDSFERDWFTDVSNPASPLSPLHPSNPASPLYPN